MRRYSLIQRASTLGYALLARLARKPHSGYELLQALKKPIGFFWRAGQSQIYPELKRLELLGLVSFEVIEQPNRPDKKLYSITSEGREALRKWAVAPVEPEPSRNELLLKTYSLWLADPGQALKLFQTHASLHINQLTRYEHILASIQQEHPTPIKVSEPQFGDYATLQMGLRFEREYVAWCRWMIEQLEQYIQEAENS
ncbi:MAG TPA: PadR family transcriptional regulator [Ktedonobacteraceae bacterium]|nr:PadR family transcriptional regulator [Ktedonobacteraceae bacterium]